MSPLRRRPLFRPSRFAGYAARPLLDQRDDEVRTVLEGVRAPAQYRALDARLVAADRVVLAVFAERMCSQAVRWCHPSGLAEAVLALCLATEADGDPPADGALVLRAADLVGELPERPFASLRCRTPAAVHARLDALRARAGAGIEAAGYEESTDLDGFRFTRRRPPAPKD